MQTIRYFDSHTHLNDAEIGDTREVLRSCREAGVLRVMNVGSDLEDSRLALRQTGEFDGVQVYAAVGIHPHSAAAYTPAWLEQVEALASAPGVHAYGEIGLDYYYGKDTKAQQLALFEEQLQLAAELGLPVLIHDRDAHGDTLSLLSRYAKQLAGGVLHCFSGSAEMAAACIKMGFYISFSGSVTFKNASNLQAAAKTVPLSRMLIETDAPYLTPVPLRGKWPNTPANVVHTAAFLAELLGIPLDELAQATWENAGALYGLPT